MELTGTELRERFYKAHGALHRLWTKDVGREGYDKSQWAELDNAIFELGRFASKAIGYDGPLIRLERTQG